MFKSLIVLLAFCSLPLVGGELTPLTAEEKIFLPYKSEEVLSLGKKDWKISEGEIKDAVSPGFDDSKWFSGMADCPLFKQGFKKRKMHTIRKTFDLPSGLEKKDLVLDLGIISFYDKVYLSRFTNF